MGSLFDTGVRPAIDQWLLDEASQVRNYGNYWSASSAGYCHRKVIFQRLGVPRSTPLDARKQRVFTAGKVFHDWIQEITKKAGLSIAQEVELQDEDFMIRGHFDDLVLIKTNRPFGADVEDAGVGGGEPEPDHLILYDYKTVNSRSFMWAKKNDNKMSHYHRMQLGTYMYMLRNVAKDVKKLGGELLPLGEQLKELSEARILKIEKENLMQMEQQLLWSDELESEVMAYWTVLNEHWKNKTIPKCTCADYEGGFLAKEAYNDYFYEGEPCSIEWYKKWKKEQKND